MFGEELRVVTTTKLREKLDMHDNEELDWDDPDWDITLKRRGTEGIEEP